MDEDFGPDIDFSALEQVEHAPSAKAACVVPPAAASIAATPLTNNPSAPKIKQPTPQVRARSGPSSILVSTRQKGNPILALIRSLPWEYSDIPSDYVLGNTTCALFLSLKYHRLHPEYIYGRIRAMAHKYNLRILLTMVDIHNHEDSLKELSKTSLINNLTLILCWSAQEAARYLELFKSYEHAAPTSIRAHQATSYRDKLVEFITVPRSINKTDAVGIVSAFGSIRAAVNARPEEIGSITGWGEKKVQRWCETVRQPFRVRKAAAARRGQLDDNNNSRNNRDGSGSGSGLLAELGDQGNQSSVNSRQEEELATLQNKEDSRIEEEEDDDDSTRKFLKDAEVGFAQNGGWKTGGQGKGRVPDNTSQPRSDAADKTAGKRAAPEDSADSDDDDDEEEALFLAGAAAPEPEPEPEGDDGSSSWLLNKKQQQNKGEATKGKSLLSPMHSSSSSSFNKKNIPPSSQAAVGVMNEGMMSALAKLREK